jgi:hypothetical protein
MIDELRKAVEKVEKLTNAEQHILAKLILDEINWDQTLANSQNQLSSLAEEALHEYKKGGTKPLQL